MTAPQQFICSNCDKLIEGVECLYHPQECNVVKLITGVIFEEPERFPNDGGSEK